MDGVMNEHKALVQQVKESLLPIGTTELSQDASLDGALETKLPDADLKLAKNSNRAIALVLP